MVLNHTVVHLVNVKTSAGEYLRYLFLNIDLNSTFLRDFKCPCARMDNTAIGIRIRSEFDL